MEHYVGNCVFCQKIAMGEFIAKEVLAVAFFDAFPISRGHALVVPRRHEPDYFALTKPEEMALWTMVNKVRERLDNDMNPDAYNIGINSGEAAGQTIGHAHIHLIPRYKGDVADPRGGIRWIFPELARYWDE